MRAPWITDWPTPPQPITATVSPAFTFAVLRAAPTPVVTPQPMSASCSSGTSVSIFTSDISSHVIMSANVPRPVIAMSGVPSPRVARGAPITAYVLAHRCDSSRRQNQQCPHAGMNEPITRSPTLTRVTSEPTASTTPQPSWPRMAWVGIGSAPLITWRSE